MGSHYATFWFNGNSFNTWQSERLHELNITMGSRAFQTSRILLKTMGGDQISLNIPLQIFTVGQLRMSFVDEVKTVRRGIGVEVGFHRGDGSFDLDERLPLYRRLLIQERFEILSQTTVADNYRFIFSGRDL